MTVYRDALTALALVFALAPVVNDICTLGCERAQAPACPLHETQPQPASDQCGHNHTELRVDVARSAHVIPPLVALPTVVHSIASAPIAQAPVPSTIPADTQPNLIARATVLRI